MPPPALAVAVERHQSQMSGARDVHTMRMRNRVYAHGRAGIAGHPASRGWGLGRRERRQRTGDVCEAQPRGFQLVRQSGLTAGAGDCPLVLVGAGRVTARAWC
jgi:hypothetical protein